MWGVKQRGGYKLKKLMLVTAMLALVLAVSVPALAQVSQGLAENQTSGNVTSEFTADSTGNNSSQCVTPLQFGNTGSPQNVQGIQQYASQGGNQGRGQYGGGFGGFFGNSGFGGGAELTGGSFTFEPTLSASCTQAVQQSSAASSNQYPVSQPVSTPQPVSSPGPSY